MDGNSKLKSDVEKEDRISGLPDSILQHILSFLPTTKEAVTTSLLLSSRWKNLWTCLPVLDFHYSKFENSQPSLQFRIDETNFHNLVNTVLLRHHSPQSINKFRLYIECTPSNLPQLYSYLDSWIATLTKPPTSIQNIDISVYVGDDNEHFALPCTLFTCKSLTSLNISMHSYLKLKPPTSIAVTKLKYLNLGGIAFHGDPSTQQLCYTFPILEELTLTTVDVFVTRVEVIAPKLNRLTICGVYDINPGLEIHVYAQSLVSFTIQALVGCKYLIHNALSLVDASIDVEQFSYPNLALHLLRGLTSAKNMLLSGQTIQEVFAVDGSARLPLFLNLTSLTVSYPSNALTLEDLTGLLHKCPNLESLFIDRAHEFTCENNEWEPPMMPHCFLSHLKSIKLGDFRRTEIELSLVKFFLKNTTVLERMIIVSSQYVLDNHENGRQQVPRQLSMLPRGSTCCTIDFS